MSNYTTTCETQEQVVVIVYHDAQNEAKKNSKRGWSRCVEKGRVCWWVAFRDYRLFLVNPAMQMSINLFTPRKTEKFIFSISQTSNKFFKKIFYFLLSTILYFWNIGESQKRFKTFVGQERFRRFITAFLWLSESFLSLARSLQNCSNLQKT